VQPVSGKAGDGQHHECEADQAGKSVFLTDHDSFGKCSHGTPECQWLPSSAPPEHAPQVGGTREEGKPSIMLRASFGTLRFDASICSCTRVYLHMDRMRSEIPPDLPMTKIMGRENNIAR